MYSAFLIVKSPDWSNLRRERGFDLPVRRLDGGHSVCGVLDDATTTEVFELLALLGEWPGAEHGTRALDHVRGPPNRVGIGSPRRVTERGESRRRLLEERHDDVVERRVPSEIFA